MRSPATRFRDDPCASTRGLGPDADARAIVQEMLSAQPEMTAERGVERLARYWNEEWIPEDLEEQLRSAGLP